MRYSLKKVGKKVASVVAGGVVLAQMGMAHAESYVDATQLATANTDGSDTIKAVGGLAIGLAILVMVFRKSQSAAR